MNKERQEAVVREERFEALRERRPASEDKPRRLERSTPLHLLLLHHFDIHVFNVGGGRRRGGGGLVRTM